MTLLFLALLGCATPAPLPTDDVAVSLAPPAPWYYYDMGDAIDWASVRFAGPEVTFRTLGDGLASGPVPQGEAWARAMACGEATRATLLFREGRLQRVVTVPKSPCVEAAAWALGVGGMQLGEIPVTETRQAVVVLDVPAEAACSRCS